MNFLKLHYLLPILKPKILITFLLIQASGILDFTTKYIFDDFVFLKWLLIACILDFITGVTKAWVKGGIQVITSRGFRNTVSKAIQYGAFIIITHLLTHYEVGGVSNSEFLWVNNIAYEFLILIEIKSVYENIVAINPKMDLLGGFIKRIIDAIKAILNK